MKSNIEREDMLNGQRMNKRRMREEEENMEDDDVNSSDEEVEENAEEGDPYYGLNKAYEYREKLNNNPDLWYNKIQKHLEKVPKVKHLNMTEKNINKIYERAVQTIAANKQQFLKTKAVGLYEDMVHRGAEKDKLAAAFTLIKEMPLYRIDLIDMLLKNAADVKHRSVQQVLETLTELFVNHLMPDRPLKTLKEQNLAWLMGNLRNLEKKQKADQNYLPTPEERSYDTILMFWYFEETLKHRYHQYIELVNSKSKGETLAFHKRKYVKTLRDCAVLIPENNNLVIRTMIEILGDKDRAVRSSGTFSILSIFDKSKFFYNPKLKLEDGIKAVMEYFFSLKNSKKKEIVRFYTSTIRVLTLFPVSKGNQPVVEEMIKNYTKIFKTLWKMRMDKKAVNYSVVISEAMQLVLKGLRYQISIRNHSKVEKEEDKLLYDELLTQLWKLVKYYHFTTTLASLRLIDIIRRLHHNRDFGFLQVRYYNVLYNFMLHTFRGELKTTPNFLQLIQSAIIHDSDENRAIAMLKRLLISSIASNEAYTAAVLIAVQKILNQRPNLKHYINNSEMKGKVYESHIPNPSNANAQNSALWLLNTLTKSYFPPVSEFSKAILDNASIKVHGDYFQQFSLMPFLNSFCHDATTNVRKYKQAVPKKNSNYFHNIPQEMVQAHEKFQSHYFLADNHVEKKKKKRSREQKAADKQLKSKVNEVIASGEDDNAEALHEEDFDGTGTLFNPKKGFEAPALDASEYDVDDDEIMMEMEDEDNRAGRIEDDFDRFEESIKEKEEKEEKLRKRKHRPSNPKLSNNRPSKKKKKQ